LREKRRAGMQKNIFLWTFIIVAISTMAFQVFSAETRSSPKGKTPALSTPESFTVTGSITRVNLKDSALVLSTKANADLMLVVDKKTNIYKAGKSIKIIDIRNGDSVKVNYEKKGGKNIAKSINVEERYTTYPVKGKSK